MVGRVCALTHREDRRPQIPVPRLWRSGDAKHILMEGHVQTNGKAMIELLPRHSDPQCLSAAEDAPLAFGEPTELDVDVVFHPRVVRRGGDSELSGASVGLAVRR